MINLWKKYGRLGRLNWILDEKYHKIWYLKLVEYNKNQISEIEFMFAIQLTLILPKYAE